MQPTPLRHLARPAIAALVLGSAAHAAHADQLDDIKKAGKIRIATVQYAAVRLQRRQAATGRLDVDAARLLAQDLGVQLDLIQVANAARGCRPCNRIAPISWWVRCRSRRSA
jgi:polar amino acid transport system substrate-binding protein